MRLPASKDSRLLVAGVAAMVALVAYLAVAFASVHASTVAANHVAPWTPYNARLIAVSRGKGRGYDVRVKPAKAGGYGGLIPTLVSDPPSGRRYAIGLWLKGSSRGGPVGVEIDEFSPGVQSVYLVSTTVPVTPRWHHFTFDLRVKGTWLGLGMYVHRQTSAAAKTWFALRNLTAGLR